MKSIPSKSDFAPYVLLALHNKGGSAKKKSAVAEVIKLMNIDENFLGRKVSSGESMIENRISWARQMLVEAGYINKETLGIWALTDKARMRFPELLSDNKRKEFAKEIAREMSEKYRRARREPAMKSIPSEFDFTPYVLLVLRNKGGSATRQDATEAIIKLMNIGGDLLAKMTPVLGDSVVRKRIDWARKRLVDTGYIDRKVTGTWTLTGQARKRLPALSTNEGRTAFAKEISRQIREMYGPGQKDPGMKPVPSIRSFAPYVLLALRNKGGSAGKKFVVKEVVDLMKLGESVFEAKTRSGKKIDVERRISLAQRMLVDAGHIDKKTRSGAWTLTSLAQERLPGLSTDEGKEKLVREISNIPPGNLIEIPGHKDPEKPRSPARVYTRPDPHEGTPTKIDEVFAQTEAKLMQISMEVVQKMDSYAFEHLCQQLLQKIGYENVKVTRKSRDDGLDGHGHLKTGFSPINTAFQAKLRSKGNAKIGKTLIDQFAGVMRRKRIERGIFITNAEFSSGAYDAAADHGIDLIGGKQLVDMLIKYKIGNKKWCVDYLDKEFFDNIK